MLKIAVIEDSQAAAQRLQEYLTRFSEEEGVALEVTVYAQALPFLEHYKPLYDMVFMDIELPYMDGMEAARRLRELDRWIVLIFVTNMAQFAVKGYEVNAMDYIVKPVRYADFRIKLRRAVAQCLRSAAAIAVVQQNGVKRMLLREIRYIEVRGHRLIYHTEAGEVFGGGTLREAEDKLRSRGFLRCNKCYLVNYRHIAAVEGSTLVMSDGDKLAISRPRKKDFMGELAECMGNGNVL